MAVSNAIRPSLLPSLFLFQSILSLFSSLFSPPLFHLFSSPHHLSFYFIFYPSFSLYRSSSPHPSFYIIFLSLFFSLSLLLPFFFSPSFHSPSQFLSIFSTSSPSCLFFYPFLHPSYLFIISFPLPCILLPLRIQFLFLFSPPLFFSSSLFPSYLPIHFLRPLPPPLFLSPYLYLFISNTSVRL